MKYDKILYPVIVFFIEQMSAKYTATYIYNANNR